MLLDVLHGFCMKGKYTGNFTTTVSRVTRNVACLTFGGLVGSMQKNGQEDAVSDFAGSLHRELGLHGECLETNVMHSKYL